MVAKIKNKLFIQSCSFLVRSCNLQCNFCKVPQIRRDYVLTTEEVKRNFDLMKEIGFEINVLFGGEPMLRKDIYELLKYANDIGLPYAFISNSTLINEDSMRRLVDSGLNNYTASIDSFNPKDERSQKGFKALEMMRENGIDDCVANMLIHANNFKEIPKLVRYFDNKGIWSILGVIQDVEEGDNFPWQYRSRSGLGLKNVDIGELEKVRDELLNLKDCGAKIHNVRSYIENLIIYGRSLDWHCSKLKYIPIDEDGTLMACVDFRGERISSKGYKLEDLIKKEKRREFVRDWKKDVKNCPGGYYNHQFQVEHLGSFDLTHKLSMKKK